MVDKGEKEMAAPSTASSSGPTPAGRSTSISKDIPPRESSSSSAPVASKQEAAAAAVVPPVARAESGSTMERMESDISQGVEGEEYEEGEEFKTEPSLSRDASVDADEGEGRKKKKVGR